MSDPTIKSRPKVIDGESGETAFQRWELPHLLTANQMEQVQKQAYEEGFARGQADGLKDAGTQTAARLAQLLAIMNSLAAPLKELDDRAEQELVTLAMNAARLIVRRELKTDPAQVLAAVREAMAALPAAARNVRLHLHPEDAVLVREHMKLHEDDHAWKVVEDPALARGGCKVLTDTSQIDASLETRLTAILATVLGGERSHDRQS